MANQPKKYKKFVATAATATLVASAIVPVASAASLSDVAGNTHEAAINALVDAKVINGYADGTFKPNKTLTRSDVVKLLGKYLESQGYEAASDYKTSPRFSDLTSSSNEELLKYAAIVADNGVFSGSNGKLLAGDNITRENMAVVLVRMINTLKGANLEEYVAGQSYTKEVKDLNAAKAEARSAIEVLDFYDITTATTFNPKGSTTRGQFATFLNNTINADFSGAAATGTVKAINATTVEVTFADAVDNIEALNFTIEGLEVSNAVVKQTDKKTVVLTTAAQTAGTEYTVSVNGNAVGKFTGVSAVVPTKVELVSTSVQGKLGQQVTVQAKVTVAEGASKAGIPVTLFVPGSTDGIKAPVTVEATTNAEGVATYTYTRYAAGTDAVTAYATGDRSKFATGYVFWGVDSILTVEEVTTGATVNNGSNKTYKITYKNPTSGAVQSGVKLNVGVLENINVTADKLQNASVNGVAVSQLSNGTVLKAAQVTTDAKGEATFTVSGTNAEVTPVVYELNKTTGESEQAYKAASLQTTAAKVKFAAIQAEYVLEVTRDGGEVAAIGDTNGGRKYNVVVKDKAGNVAKNEIVNVAFNEDLDKAIATNTKAKFIKVASDDTQSYYPATAGTDGNTAKKITVKTDSSGKASFVVGSDDVNDYVTPVAWIDINTSNAIDGGLDNGEPNAVGAISYFQAQYLDGAGLTSYLDNTKTTSFKGNETATFKTALTNQSGKPYNANAASITSVTYTVTNTGANNIEVYEAESASYKTVSPNRSLTTTYSSTSGDLKVNSDSKSSSVKVVATGYASYYDISSATTKTYAFTAKEATATFTATNEVANPHTGLVQKYNTTNKTITFAGKDAIKYAGVTGKTYKYYGIGSTPIATADAFIDDLKNAGGGQVTVTYQEVDDVVSFYITNKAASGIGTAPVLETPTAANNAPVAKTVGTKTIAANATTPLTFTTSDLAVDNDAGDSLKIVTAYTTNASVATANVAPGQLSFTLTPVATGTTTVTVVVADNAGLTATVNFDVVVTAASYFSLVGNPGVPYSETAAKPASIELTPAAVGGPVTLTLTEDVSGSATPTTLAVTVPASTSADALATLINNQAGLEGKAAKFTAVSNGTIVTVTTPAGDNTIATAGAGATAGTTVAGTAIVKNPSAYSFKVDGTPTAGTIVKVAVGSEYYEYTVTAADVTANSTIALATAIAADLATQAGVTTPAANVTAFNTKYAVTTSGDVVIITQKAAASTTDSLAVTTR